MSYKTIILWAIILFGIISIPYCSKAEPRVEEQRQYQIYCLQYPNECPNDGPKYIIYSKEKLTTIFKVNNQVNKIISPRNEKVDIWTASSDYGDCDDYVMRKRSELIKLGFPPRALRPRFTKYKSNQYNHLVLEVHTTKGVYVLDNIK